MNRLKDDKIVPIGIASLGDSVVVVPDVSWIRFDHFRLDLESEQLLDADADAALPLTPKAFAVLAHLARHRGRLMTKQELLDAVWGERYVTDAVLKVAVREIRKTLGDDARQPRYIETVHRKGYRFIAESRGDAGTGLNQADGVTPVGRAGAFEALRDRLDRALDGQRQVVLVTGEPGIGKTTLVESFLGTEVAVRGCWRATGHCLEQYGAGEPYLPVLEALGRLAAEPGRELLLDVLRRYAPTWLKQLPALQRARDRAALERETLGATPERMLREMGEALEALTAEAPLVLVLEDLHWSDVATLDLITMLARRPEPARLLLIGTYRPADARWSDHPLHHVRRELESRGQSVSLRLGELERQAVAEYLSRRFEGAAEISGLAAAIHRHTDGNPLFMVNVADYLVAEGRLLRDGDRWRLDGRVEDLQLGVPEGFRQLVERQIDRLDERDRQLLAAASVVGIELSAVALADALEADVIEVEERCDRLVELRQFLRHTGAATLADGTFTARYAFIHAVYQQVLYQRLPEARRRRYHLRVGEGGERIFGAGARELAAELAVHFEEARDVWRAVRYLQQAAATAVRRYANREAAGYLTRALELAGDRPAAEQGATRAQLLESRGLARRASGDMSGAAADFEALARLAAERGERPLEVQALLLLTSALYWVRRDRCLEIADRAAERGAELSDPLARAHARGYCAHWHLNLRGWSDDHATAFRRALATVQERGDATARGLYLVRDVYFRCWQSDYRGAGRVAEQALELALEAGDAFEVMVCEFFRVWALLHGGDWGRIGSLLREGIEMAERNGHHLWAHLFRVERAWLHVEAFDDARAVELCTPAVEIARREPLETGQLLFKSLIVLGHARLGQGRVDAAARCFQETLGAIDRGVLMDRILDLPLHFGLARCALEASDLGAARREADRLCRLAAGCGEHTYLALGRAIQVEVALAAGELDRARARLEEAAGDLDVDHTPLAAWRFYATAARYHRRRDDAGEANACAERSRKILERLAAKLGPGDALAASVRARVTAG